MKFAVMQLYQDKLGIFAGYARTIIDICCLIWRLHHRNQDL